MSLLSGAEVTIISNNSSVAEGESALLTCVGSGPSPVVITWIHKGRVILTSPQATILEEHVFVGTSRFTQSFLRICSVGLKDAGDYTCVVSIGETSANSSTHLTVTGKFKFFWH